MTSVFGDWPDDRDDAARQIAERVLPQRDQFIGDLYETTLREVPELGAGEERRTLLYASIAENTVVLINALSSSVDPASATPPPGAVEFARELARTDVSLAALLRAYRIGQARFTALCLGATDEIDDITALRVVIAKVAAFIDHISEAVTENYESERDRHIATRSGLTQHLIQRMLEGSDADAAVAADELGYRLDGRHTAIDLASRAAGSPRSRTASDDLAQAHQLLTAVFGDVAVIDTPTGAASLCLWVSDLDLQRITAQTRECLRTSGLAVQAAIGLTGDHLAGFRRTHRQALRVRSLCTSAEPAPPQVVNYLEIAPIAMLTDDLDELRTFVTATLGDLAADTVRLAELRETLLAYLRAHRSPAATAQQLMMHRNTVRYRIAQVDSDFPDLLNTADPYVVITALELCRWYGSSVAQS